MAEPELVGVPVGVPVADGRPEVEGDGEVLPLLLRLMDDVLLLLELMDEVPVPLTEPLVLMVPDAELDRLVLGVVPGV